MSEPKTVQPCPYHRLMGDLAYYATREWRPDTETCPVPAEYYVSVAFNDGNGEALRNVCPVHEPMVRTLPGWNWSRPKQVSA